MPSYKYKIADSKNKIVVIDVELPSVQINRTADNPDSNWTTETPGLLAREMGRVDSGYSYPMPTDATNDLHIEPASGDAPLPMLALGTYDLYPCEMLAPRNYGLVIHEYHSGFSANDSGVGQLYSAWVIAGGMAAGPITWVQV